MAEEEEELLDAEASMAGSKNTGGISSGPERFLLDRSMAVVERREALLLLLRPWRGCTAEHEIPVHRQGLRKKASLLLLLAMAAEEEEEEEEGEEDDDDDDEGEAQSWRRWSSSRRCCFMESRARACW
jgi:hypothetical protein